MPNTETCYSPGFLANLRSRGSDDYRASTLFCVRKEKPGNSREVVNSSVLRTALCRSSHKHSTGFVHASKPSFGVFLFPAGTEVSGGTLFPPDAPSTWALISVLVPSQPSDASTGNPYQQVEALGDVPANWNSYGAAAPNKLAISHVRLVVEQAMSAGLSPSAVVPTSEGGAAVIFRNGRLHGDIECFNDGEILALATTGTEEPEVRPVSTDAHDIAQVLEWIRGAIGR